jgi:large subunit ribosomal protein L18
MATTTRKKQKEHKKKRRAHRVRARIHGTAERPRLSVHRSLKHIYVQLINDDEGHTIAAASDLDDEISTDATAKEIAASVGELIAERAQEEGVEQVVFDRGPYRYHGRVAALADGAREGGLDF